MGLDNSVVASEVKALTVSNTVIEMSDFGFIAANLEAADLASVSCIGEPVMFTYDGTDPTPTLGIPLTANQTVSVGAGVNINALKFIRQGALDATVSIQLEGYGKEYAELYP